ncbi:LysR family transcriptional regulator [Novosphingobium sp. G106]|uniref:LysR family transcriptional regulator n=1 Tax=Novosphingobium sp. G106 TaxID=2849500 RepID=UPI001C2D94B5|nr:LysR family transcriptional regulator [Novosphingobium sp. G106]MBV1687787.1 LysR family transcriptional regulator [Novosphingobium sp. G106]
MLEFYLLRHFIAVAETRSFTRAAAALNSTQPVVSRTIKRLEEIVGTPLLHRTTRSLSLTPAGEAFLGDVRLAVDQIAVATEKARRIGRGPRAKLRIAACPSVDPLFFAGGLQDFRSHWPDVELELKPINGLLQERALLSAEIDIGICHCSASERSPDLDFAYLAREAPMVVVPAIWKLGLQSARLEYFRETRWIFPDREVAPREFERLLQICRKSGFEPNIVATACNSAESALLLSTGYGAMFALRSESGPDPLRGYDFIEIEDYIDDYRDIYIAWVQSASSEIIADFVNRVVPDRNPPVHTERLSLAANFALVPTALVAYLSLGEMIPFY